MVAAPFAGHLNDLYRYSPQGEWEALVQDEMLVARARLRMSALGGRIYLFGGFGLSGMCVLLHLRPCIVFANLSSTYAIADMALSLGWPHVH